jgi:hypothetical protein
MHFDHAPFYPATAALSPEESRALEALKAKGVPIDYDQLMGSGVYDPGRVPGRLSKPEVCSRVVKGDEETTLADFPLYKAT